MTTLDTLQLAMKHLNDGNQVSIHSVRLHLLRILDNAANYTICYSNADADDPIRRRGCAPLDVHAVEFMLAQAILSNQAEK